MTATTEEQQREVPAPAEPTHEEVSTAFASYDPGAGTQGLVVADQVRRFQEFARVLSQSELLPDGLRGKPANVFMALMQGLDLGLRPMQALNLIDVIKGKPAMNAQGMRAQILAAGHRYRIVENTDERCTIAAHRKDWPDDEWPETTFTIDQAKQAGLAGGENWKKYPADMLLARATSRMAKAYFSDVTNGLSSVEELLDIAPPAATRTLAEVAAEREKDKQPEQPATEVGADGQPVVDAEVIDDADDEEIRAAVLAEAARGGTGEMCECGQIPAHTIEQCPTGGVAPEGLSD
jgi:hypothetical protein